MQIITEQQIAEILDPEIAFFAVQDVFKSMETEAWNFPVVHLAPLGYWCAGPVSAAGCGYGYKCTRGRPKS